MSDLTVNLLGFAAVNRDLKVQLRDPVTTTVVREVQPFLDGTVRVPQIEAGAYELTVTHPNLTVPVLRRPIRILPVGDTRVSVLIDPSQFRNTPVADIPEANLTPVRQLTESVAETIVPLATKQPGEAIKAEDWNAMAASIRDLAHAVGELSRLVSPTGHDHQELIDKTNEMQSNFETLLNTLSASMAELQRQIQSQRFRQQIEAVLADAQVDRLSAQGREFLDLATTLEQSVTESPVVFARRAQNVGVQLETRLSTLLDQKRVDPATPDLDHKDSVRGLGTAVDLLKTQRSTTYDAELEHSRKTDRVLGAGGLNAVLGERVR